MKIPIVAEIGINHNADLSIAKKLIDVAALAGCQYVKFQKRNPDKCVPEEQKKKIKETPWGTMTYLDYKHKMEFNFNEYAELVSYAHNSGISIFSSAWDTDSVDFLTNFATMTKDLTHLTNYKNSVGVVIKIPSACITDIELLKYARKKSDILIISTGMSTEEEILTAINEGNPDIILHTCSAYPSPIEELNLNYIKYLEQKHPTKAIGWSNHYYGLVPTYAAVGMGAEIIEFHITLNHDMWGSDQKSSVEPSGVFKLVKGIRDIESAMGTFGPRKITKSELDKLKSLRK